MKIYYDEEGDYLEIFIGDSRLDYGEELADGVTLFRDQETDEVFGIGIIGFKKRAKIIRFTRCLLSKTPTSLSF